jgi:DNA repair exonuclease SbcCD ATPase subunit
MGNKEDLTPEPQDLGDSLPGTPPPPPAGQPESERIKGFNRKINELNTALASKTAALNELKIQYDTDIQSRADAMATLEQELADARSKLATAENAHKTVMTQFQEAQGKLATRESRDEQRKLLLGSEEIDLLPFFESGNFPLDGVADMETLKVKASQFRNMMSRVVQKQFTGAQDQTPPPAPNPTGLSQEELGAWLMDPANENKPEYDKFNQAFIALAPTDH